MGPLMKGNWELRKGRNWFFIPMEHILVQDLWVTDIKAELKVQELY